VNNISKTILYDTIIMQSKGKIENYSDWSSLNDGDYILIHFGDIQDIPSFCEEIKEWKTYIKKDVIILPISRSKQVPPAETLYNKVKNNKITRKILEESKRFWETECGITLKKKIIPKLLGLALLIDTAEVLRKKNDIQELKAMKKQIDEELKIIENIEKEINKRIEGNKNGKSVQPDKYWSDSLLSIRKVIAAAKLYDPFPSKEQKEFNQIFKDICNEIKDLKNKLQESPK
jgi:hypothetical protein